MQLILIQELIKTVGSGVVLLVLSMHNVDVVDELGEEILHTLGRRIEFHDLVEGSISFCLCDLSMDLEVLLEASECGRWIKVFAVEPVQLLVDVLLGEDEDLELFRLYEVGALGNLFNEHAEKIASLLQELL